MKIILSIILTLTFGVSAMAEDDSKIHKELHALITGIENAVNSKQYGELKQFFHKNLKVTTVNQNTISTPESIATYFEGWFGEDGYLVSLNMKLKSDSLTELYANKTMGIVRGSGVEQYKLKDGRNLDLNTRWTATVIKDIDGKWRILTLHIGTNFYDNAIYNEMSEQLKKWGLIGSFLTFLIGLLLGYWIKTKRIK